MATLAGRLALTHPAVELDVGEREMPELFQRVAEVMVPLVQMSKRTE